MRAYIFASSDTERDPERKLRWGDYWLKRNLARALEADGWMIDAELGDATDVFVHCYGGVTISNPPAHTYNVLYIHSHPANLNGFDFRMYDRVVAGSQKLADALAEQGVVASVNTGATDFKPLDVPLMHDAVFVGNARDLKDTKTGDIVTNTWGGGVYDAKTRYRLTRPIIEALGDLTTLPFKLEVWGEGWDWLPKGVWQGPFIHNDELNALYSGSAVVLNDTHADMVEWNIINPRVLDALASGTTLVTDGYGFETDHAVCGPYDDVRKRIAERVAMRKAWYRPPPRAEDWSYARLVQDLVGGIGPRLRLDLGCGSHKREGYVGVDKVHAEGVDIVWDIRRGMPATDAVDYAVADNLMEHIGDEFIQSMNGVHDALAPGGRFSVTVPDSTNTVAAFADPTHVRWFVLETWDYFDIDNLRWQDYGRSYGIKPWRVLRRAKRDRFIDVVLSPVKEQLCAS